MEVLIKKYFYKNFKYEEIRDLFLKVHGIETSLSTIKRTLSSFGLRRKNIEESDIKEICRAIVEELHSAGYNLGYTSLWLKLKKKYGLTVKRNTVYNILKIADPEGLADRFANKLRRREYLSPGPNFMWHTDGYDKLKPFGFAIHGCIDGFSRMILWLEVATTNNDPKVTAHYFLSTIFSLKFLPTIMRSDKGSENTLIESLQICLRSKDEDKFSGEKSVIKGRSVHNQRIESYWGQMRRHSADFYIQFFKCMMQKNLFDGSKLHKMCLQYCFGPLIKEDLYLTKKLWNEHRIRKQAARNNIAGKPYILFHLPEKVNARNYKKDTNGDVVKRLLQELTTKPHFIDPHFKELVELILPEVQIARSPEEALELYKKILNRISQYTNESNR